MMEKIRESVQTSFYLRHTYSYKIHIHETGAEIIYYKKSDVSPLIYHMSEAKAWPNEEENCQLESGKIDLPHTKWNFVEFFNVDVKVVLDRQPLLGA